MSKYQQGFSRSRNMTPQVIFIISNLLKQWFVHCRVQMPHTICYIYLYVYFIYETANAIFKSVSIMQLLYLRCLSCEVAWVTFFSKAFYIFLLILWGFYILWFDHIHTHHPFPCRDFVWHEPTQMLCRLPQPLWVHVCFSQGSILKR